MKGWTIALVVIAVVAVGSVFFYFVLPRGTGAAKDKPASRPKADHSAAGSLVAGVTEAVAGTGATVAAILDLANGKGK